MPRKALPKESLISVSKRGWFAIREFVRFRFVWQRNGYDVLLIGV